MQNDRQCERWERGRGGFYTTKIVGKWQLGHREGYHPTDEWFGIPYHMSAGSLDGHMCGNDWNRTKWLPLFCDHAIEEQPVNLTDLMEWYAAEVTLFVEENTSICCELLVTMSASGPDLTIPTGRCHHHLCRAESEVEAEKILLLPPMNLLLPILEAPFARWIGSPAVSSIP
mmetsp:Transcript_24533/g.45389  ORF Transcript_24533/g.45389 Transcript_24533/m.45389 type:complete len:172 (+) Transcript_24533:234-749(+)